MKTSILEYLEESARKYPDKTAFADEHTSCTFKELEQTARRTGTALAKHFTPRNPVPVFMEKSVETIGVFMGAVYAGCFLCTDGYKTAGEQTSADPWNSGQ